jgi:prevent-host-death family protein
MTRIQKRSGTGGLATAKARPHSWLLQDAKARFSELVRKARGEGPQLVTLHGRPAVVVIDAEEYQRVSGGRSGRALIDAMHSSPFRDTELAPDRAAMPVRGVQL